MMTTLLVILAVWVVCSIPLALIFARLFRSAKSTPLDSSKAAARPVVELSVARRRKIARSASAPWVGRTSAAHLVQDGARAATGSRSAH
jgi:hypothetical protein